MIVNGFTPDMSLFQNKAEEKVSNGTGFDAIFKDTLDKVNDKQVIADLATEEFIKGGDIEIHEVMLATEEAKMSLQMAVQVRNKLVEAVQELTRMQL